MVGVPQTGLQFWVDVKGLSSNNAWLIKPKPDHLNLFYILIRVGESRKDDRFFVLSQPQMNRLLARARAERKATDTTEGFRFSYPQEYEGRWNTLPGRVNVV